MPRHNSRSIPGIVTMALPVALAVVGGITSACAGTPQRDGPAELTMLYARDLGLDTGSMQAGGSIAVASGPSVTKASRQASTGPVVTRVFAMASPVANTELGEIRGGFALPGGVNVSFGFDVATSLAGRTLQQLTLPVTSLGAGGPQSVPVSVSSAGNSSVINFALGTGAAPVAITSLANGGATSVTTALTSGGISSLVQNRMDGQLLQQTRTFDVSITGLKAALAQQATYQLVTRALSVGASLR